MFCGWIGLDDGFGPPRLQGWAMWQKYIKFLLYITINDFITILYHVVFSILQVV